MDTAVFLIGQAINTLLPFPQYHAPHYFLTQFLACCITNYLGGVLFYLLTASFSYFYFFRCHRARYYPSTLPDDISQQIKTEIGIAMRSFPLMSLAFSPFTFGVTRGWSKMYSDVDEYGWGYLVFSVLLFLLVTDCVIYYIHRALHTPWLYNHVHKPHHTYRYTTPFSSHAFHWADGWSQGVPYYIFVYFFPFHRYMWLIMFVFVNCWTVMIHDQVDFIGHFMFIQSTGHHTLHHSKFCYNYGQYFTFWDKINGTHLLADRTHDPVTGERLSPSPEKKNISRP